MTYQEEVTQLILDSSIAVFVLMGDHDDVEFIPCRPREANEAFLAELKTRWAGRGLRPLGWIGLCGDTPRAVFKNPEPLEERQYAGLAQAFVTYCETLQPGHIEDARNRATVGDEIEWLEKLYAHQDARS